MYKLISFFSLSLVLLFTNVSYSAGTAQWALIGPGDADQVTSLSVLDDGSVFAGTDVGGIYASVDQGGTWKDRNIGLDNYDVTTTVIQDTENKQILYVGTRGGFYKSLDHGATWQNKREGLPPIKKYSLSGSVGSIVINPHDPKNILLGLGYRPSGDGTKTVRNLKGSMVIYESFDKGETWNNVKVFSVPTKVYQLQFSKSIPNQIYAATNTGVYTGSTSGGLWQKLLDKHCYNMLSFKDRPELIISACGNDGIYLSTDGGKNWATSNKGLSFGIFNTKQRYSVLEASADSPDILYLVNSTWNMSGGLYKSTNRGSSWIKISKNMPESWLSTSKKMNAIAIDPDNSKRLYLGSSRYLYKSDNAGQSWEQLISQAIGDGWSHRGINVFGHTRDIVVDTTNKNRIYMATSDHGLLASVDAGKSWKEVTKGLSYSSHVLDIEQCIANPEVFYWVGSNLRGDSCLYQNNKNHTAWLSKCHTWLGKVSATSVLSSPVDCDTVYIATNNKILITFDAGRTWSRVGDGLPPGRVFSMASSADGKVIYAGMKNGLFFSKDKGETWQQLKSLMNNTVVSILISRTDPDFLLIGTEAGRDRLGGVFLSHDGGKTAVNVLKIRKLVSGIVQHPVDPKIFFASTNDHNYHDVSSGSGIYFSIDSGENWMSLNEGLAVNRAWNIFISQVSNKVYLSANGSGGYVLDLSEFDSFIK